MAESARLLVAEDETIIRVDLRSLLERSGFEVCAEARDGEEAVALARVGAAGPRDHGKAGASEYACVLIRVVPVILLAAALGAPLADAHDRPGNFWNEKQAESITTIRGTPVRVRKCEGVGKARERVLYRHFSCVAGTRLASQPIDTALFLEVRGGESGGSFPVRAGGRLDEAALRDLARPVAVTYTLHPLGEYSGRRSRYALTNVKFIGHGVP